MKFPKISLLLIVIVFYGCLNISENKKLSLEDSLKVAIKDSILQAKKDSIEKAEAERLAYLNRPWKLNTYVDDYGESTKDKFIKTTTEGYFSNSATTKDYLYVKVFVDKDGAGIFLHQYNKSSSPEKFIGTATIKMKNEAGQEIKIYTAHSWNQSGGILIQNFTLVKGAETYDFLRFRNFINKSVGKIKVVIYDEYSSVYRFDIDATGFTKEYQLIYK